ncbi:MAG: cupin domain-containing protein [Chitinophagaceae bacterium]|nr:cupin domain-containing protein [Chitinophagaceae bacterium]
MQRRDFLQKSGLLASIGLISTAALSNPVNSVYSDDVQPVLLPPLPPLEHNGGLNIRTWIRSEMTGGVYSNVETAVAPKTMGPPPHYHKELDELMFVLEGTASVLVGNDIVEVKAGGWHLRPRLIQHTFWNSGETSLRFIDMYFNQPFEQYLERIFFELTEKNGFPEGSEVKIKELNSLNQKFGVIFSETSFKDFDDIKRRFGLK